MNFTSDQHDAVYTHDQNVIVIAGAGSGKTRVLVERYLALLERNPDWSLNALVAITFTKKAAGEMRDRVRLSLTERLQSALEETENLRWSQLLTAMDSARIDTIHGLCATLLRANAAQAGVDPDFVVLDETDAAILLDEAIENALVQMVAENDPAVRLFTEYEGLAIRETLADFSLLNAVHDLPDDLMILWMQQWWDDIPSYINGFLSEAEAIGTVDPADDALGKKWQDCLDWLAYLNQNPGGDSALNALNEIAGINLRGGSAKNWGGEEEFALAKKVLTAIRDAAKATLDVIGEPPGAFDERAAEMLPLWASLLRRVAHHYRTMKTSAAQLDFNDLEALTRDLLLNHPEVRARYQGAEFRHLLVDEFQDTNADQWAIVQSLAGLDTPGSMFVVGDEKQSIYAFRGADVSVFGSVRQQIVASGGKPIDMVESFRTHRPLVTHFNAIFARLLVRDLRSPVSAYQVELGVVMTAFREFAPPGDHPPIEMLLIDGRTLQDDGPKIGIEDCRRREAYEIANRLREMVDSGRVIYDKAVGEHRPMHYGDAAILFQSLSNVTLYEEAFKNAGLPFVTLAGRGYYNRQEVWDLLNLLNVLYNPADELALMSALRSPLFGLSDDALLALRIHADDRKILLWDVLAAPSDWLPNDELASVAFAREVFYALRGSAGRVTISELLRDALARTGYLAILTGLPDGARRRGNIEKLLEKAQSSGKVTLGAFSAYLRDLSAREVREGEALLDSEGAVQIMSVHASKGLEFPVVVLADASWEKSSGSSDILVYDGDYGLACKVYDAEKDKLTKPYAYRRAERLRELRDDAERLRLFYVAATRAQDALIVSGQISEDKKTGAWRGRGWIGHLIEALELTENLATADTDWGRVQIFYAADSVADDEIATAPLEEKSAWENQFIQAGASLPGEAVKPLLLNEIVIQREAQARHLSATHIADLGSIEESIDEKDRAFYRSRFRRQVLHDAPSVVDWVSDRASGVSPRQIGEIVHEVLRWWRFPQGMGDADYMEMLRNYAWKQGITDDLLCDRAAVKALELLIKFKESDVYHRVQQAVTVYRELPFIYECDGRIIHGVIDVLFRERGGGWVIADYKTSTVRNAADNPALIAHHARRYHLQLGVYAEAVREQLGGAIPETIIHYIRYTHTVRIEESDWQGALSRGISGRVMDLIEDVTL